MFQGREKDQLAGNTDENLARLFNKLSLNSPQSPSSHPRISNQGDQPTTPQTPPINDITSCASSPNRASQITLIECIVPAIASYVRPLRQFLWQGSPRYNRSQPLPGKWGCELGLDNK